MKIFLSLQRYLEDGKEIIEISCISSATIASFLLAFRSYIHRAEPSQEEDSYMVLVCHSPVIWYLLKRTMQLPLEDEAWKLVNLTHASITWIEILKDGGIFMHLLNSSSHLPEALVTSSNE